jgi:L-ascorbate metabolism protein UlaG (beta-lactamase superfamily)
MQARPWILSTLALAGATVWIMRKRAPARSRAHLLDLRPSDAATSEMGSVQFIGNATTLIRYQGLTILTDPNFLGRGDRVHLGYGLHATRLTEPALDFDRLPPIDFVLLSHLHEDHFDKLVEARLPRHTPILTTSSAALTLRRRGFTGAYGLRVWDYVNVRKGHVSLRVTSMPASHGPLLAATALPDVMGAMLDFRNSRDARLYRMYIGGDTVLHGEMDEIARRFRNIDLALLHLGGERVLGLLVTLDAAKAVECLSLLRPEMAIPIHYNDYDNFSDPIENFLRAAERAGFHDKLRHLYQGESYSFLPRATAIETPELLGAAPLV